MFTRYALRDVNKGTALLDWRSARISTVRPLLMPIVDGRAADDLTKFSPVCLIHSYDLKSGYAGAGPWRIVNAIVLQDHTALVGIQSRACITIEAHQLVAAIAYAFPTVPEADIGDRSRLLSFSHKTKRSAKNCQARGSVGADRRLACFVRGEPETSYSASILFAPRSGLRLYCLNFTPTA